MPGVLIGGLSQKDLEDIERLIYKSGDDIAVSIARSFERMEERMDSMESRLYGRLTDIEDKLPSGGYPAEEFIPERDPEALREQ
jgi:hypothetical protein